MVGAFRVVSVAGVLVAEVVVSKVGRCVGEVVLRRPVILKGLLEAKVGWKLVLERRVKDIYTAC